MSFGEGVPLNLITVEVSGTAERKKRQGDWSHVFVLTVSETAFAFLSQLLRVAFFITCSSSELFGL
jgi:hypothetical protein